MRRSKMHRQIIDKIEALHGFLFHFKFYAFRIHPTPAHNVRAARNLAKYRLAYAAKHVHKAPLSQKHETTI